MGKVKKCVYYSYPMNAHTEMKAAAILCAYLEEYLSEFVLCR